MASIDDLREAITAYPAIEEAATNMSFRAVTFKVQNKGIIGVEKDMIHATFALSEKDAQEVLTDSELAAEAITKSGALIGVRAELGKLAPSELRGLVAKSLASTQRA